MRAYFTYVSGRQFVRPALVLLHTLENATHRRVVMVRNGSVSARELQWLAARAEVRVVQPPWSYCLDRARFSPRWKYVFEKLFVVQQTDFSEILYIDADAIVVGNIEPYIPWKKIPHPYGLVADGNLSYFNNGVMLLRPHHRWAEELRSICCEWQLSLYKGLPGDQDVVLRWAQRHASYFRPLLPRLNLRTMHLIESKAASIRGPHILHFAGVKPWDPASPSWSTNVWKRYAIEAHSYAPKKKR